MIDNDLPITKPLSVEEPSLTDLADDKTMGDFESTWDWKCYKYFLPRPNETPSEAVAGHWGDTVDSAV